MKKFRNFLEDPINRTILWILTGIIIFLVGVLSPKADTITYKDFTAQLYDNNNGSLSTVTTNFTNGSYRGTIPYMVANSSGGAWGISSGKPLLANHTYSFTIQISGPYGGKIVLSTYNRIGVGTSLSSAVSSYSNNSYVTENYSNANGDKGVIQYAFTPTVNGSYIVFPFSVNSTGSNQEYWIDSFIIEDLGSGVSEATINNSLTNQTNIINNSITSTKNEILDNQNRNTEELQETIENQYNNCKVNTIDFSDYKISSGVSSCVNVSVNKNLLTITTSGCTSTGYVTFPINNLTSFTNYTVSYNTYDYNNGASSNVFRIRTGRTSGTWVTDAFPQSSNQNFTFSSSNYDTLYLWYYILSTNNSVTKVYDLNIYNPNYCVNKLDEQTDAINDVNDTLNDDDTTGATAEASDFFSDFTTDTFGLTSIITAPLNLIQSLTSSTCTALHLPLPYLDNKYLDLPCMSTIYSQFFGSFFTLYQTITFGIVAYWVCVRIFNQVKDFKNPEHDEIEVLDL